MSEDAQKDNGKHVRSNLKNLLRSCLFGLRTQAILYNFRRTPHTIVLDSLHPDLAPHLVITPPPDTWEDSRHAYENRINPQYMANLFVPPFYLFTCRTPTYEEWKAIAYPPPQRRPQPYTPVATFNYSRFHRYVSKSGSPYDFGTVDSRSLHRFNVPRRKGLL